MSASRQSSLTRLLDFFRTADLELVLVVGEAAARIVRQRQAEQAKVPQAPKRTRRPRAAGAPSQTPPTGASEA